MEIERHILTRYFLGECNEDEKEAIHQWLEGDEANKKEFINERIRFDASLIIEEDFLYQENKPYKKISLRLFKVASVILLVLSSGYFATFYNDYKTQSRVIEQNVYVPAANRTQLILPDGTLVWLNSNTSLKYPSMFLDKEERVVELDGEAYFDVAKDKNKAFIVKTHKYNVEVLGTSFDIEAYKNKPTFKVALFTGKIKIYEDQAREKALNLEAGEAVELIDDELQTTYTNSNVNSWLKGLIVIEDKSFEEIILLFEKYFGEEIIIENDKVKDLGYRGKLRIADGVDHALRVLQNDFHFNYKHDKDKNIIYIY